MRTMQLASGLVRVIMCLGATACGMADDPEGDNENLAEQAATATCTQVAERSTATLSCPSGQVVKSVTFGSYGTPTGSCPSLSQGTCHASTSKSKLESLCLNKQSCSVVATNSTFGDPCVGTLKKLAIKYTCDAAAPPPAGTCAQVAERSTATLSCPSGQVVKSITFGSYGTPTGSCPSFAQGACHASTSKSRLESLCLNKQSCSVAATNSTFGDPCVGKSKKLAVTYTCDKGEAPPPNPDPNSVLPVFLLAGQSNMEGNVNRDLLMEILSELVQGPQNTLQQRVEAPLTRWYTTAQPSVYSAQTVTHEAEELIRIRATGVVGSALLTPLPNIFCSKNDSGIKPLQVGAGCGNPFGPELVLGHYLKTTPHAPTSLIKVAKGGTTLLTDWRSPSAVAASGGAVGEWYTKLEQRIGSITSAPATVHPRCSVGKCRWAAFIWFQGENDCFNPANADPYQQNLTYLLKDVRAKIGNAKLPVLVVEIGPWAQGLSNGYKVVAAQRAVVAADANAELVPTSDLSSHYHFDPAAQLIIGYRVANVLAPMLK